MDGRRQMPWDRSTERWEGDPTSEDVKEQARQIREQRLRAMARQDRTGGPKGPYERRNHDRGSWQGA
jgi:hypothetical protein